MLFGQMARGDKKYIDPTPVIRCVNDNNGVSMLSVVGEEQDIG